MSFGFKGYWFCMILTINSVNQLIFLMVKYGVFFKVRTEFLNIIFTNFGFKGLNELQNDVLTDGKYKHS
jgi:hypothetical protein